jgi:DNA-binding LytR/AlgR family response regulator
MRVLIVEDGFEYSETLRRFLPDIEWERAGGGPEALARLAGEAFDAVFLDMRFDRVEEDALLGDLAAVADRFNGDPVQARAFLQDHQGVYVLAALREAGHALPALVSYDFGGEPRRWSRLAAEHAPVDYLPDVAGPVEIRSRLLTLTGTTG